MWQRTHFHEALIKDIQEILSSNKDKGYFPTGELELKLRQYPVADSFAAVLDERIEPQLFVSAQNEKFNKWIERIDDWLERVQDPRNDTEARDSILYVFWDRFATNLADNLRAGRIVAAIPTEGYVLAFVGALQKCIVVHYEFFGFIPKLETKIVIDKPKSAFDWWEAIDSVSQSSHASRNYLKNVLTSGHKLIYHRGILVHVDRREERDVFGPSIDTLVMAEELARTIYEPTDAQKINTRVALEIGSGSGFLASSIVKNIPSLTKLVCIDIQSRAISCTEKNIRIANFAPGSHKPNLSLIIGAFDEEKFQPKADLIVCNPPYIPRPPNIKPDKSKSVPHLSAVGGLELIEQILRALPNLLSEQGQLLLMVSHLCIKETEELIKDLGLTSKKPFDDVGYEVLFDVEAVIEDESWKDFLINCEAKIYNKEKEDVFYHRLEPLWVGLK